MALRSQAGAATGDVSSRLMRPRPGHVLRVEEERALARRIADGDERGARRPDRGEPATRRRDGAPLPGSRAVVPRPRAGGDRRSDPGGRPVRLAPRAALLDVRRVVDPAGDPAGADERLPHDPAAEPARREAAGDPARRGHTRGRARPDGDDGRDRRGDRLRRGRDRGRRGRPPRQRVPERDGRQRRRRRAAARPPRRRDRASTRATRRRRRRGPRPSARRSRSCGRGSGRSSRATSGSRATRTRSSRSPTTCTSRPSGCARSSSTRSRRSRGGSAPGTSLLAQASESARAVSDTREDP